MRLDVDRDDRARSADGYDAPERRAGRTRSRGKRLPRDFEPQT